MKLRMLGSSNIGQVRKNNEDTIFFNGDMGISIVCDGIGGREGGEIASQITAENMKLEILNWQKNPTDPVSFLKSAAQNCNKMILQKGAEQSRLEGMGTTMECSMFVNDQVYLAHIGDSRTYLYCKKHLWQLTVDHNVKTLVEYGEIPTEISNFSNADSLVKALGVSNNADIEVYKMKLAPGLLFLSASDGLFDMVEGIKIAEILDTNEGNLHNMLDRLTEEACKNGGFDNISIVITAIE